MGNAESGRVRIGNWNYAGVPLFVGFGVFPAFLLTFTWAALTEKFNTETGETNWAFLICIGGALALGTVLMFCHALTSPVLWIELGDQIAYRNPLRRRCHDWSEISSLKFEDERSKVKIVKVPGAAIPLGEHRILVVILRNKRELRVKVTDNQEEIIKQLWGRHQSLPE